MTPHHPVVLTIVSLAFALLFTGCSDDEGPGDPDDVAQAYCDAVSECFDDMDDDELQDCITEITDDYAYYEDQSGPECRDALLETDHCLSQQSCEDLRDNVGCSAEFEREEQLCFGNG